MVETPGIFIRARTNGEIATSACASSYQIATITQEISSLQIAVRAIARFAAHSLPPAYETPLVVSKIGDSTNAPSGFLLREKAAGVEILIDAYSIVLPIMIRLQDEPIDTEALLASIRTRQAGAVVLFLGTVREVTRQRRTESLDYECYPAMAESKLAELEREARARWPVLECAIVHRLGHMEPAEVSVAVAVCTAHRRDAFEAALWLIDTLKEQVPIWKKENWADGQCEWVHPGLPPASSPGEAP